MVINALTLALLQNEHSVVGITICKEKRVIAIDPKIPFSFIYDSYTHKWAYVTNNIYVNMILLSLSVSSISDF